MSDPEFGRTVADAVQLAARAHCVFINVQTGPYSTFCFSLPYADFVRNVVGWHSGDTLLPSMLETYRDKTWLVIGAEQAIQHAQVTAANGERA